MLNESNFEELTRSRWRLISSREVASWLNDQQLTACESFEFEMFMHGRKTSVEIVPPGLIRETVDIMSLSEEQVRTLEAQSSVVLDVTARQNF